MTVIDHSAALAAIAVSRETARQCMNIFRGEGNKTLAEADRVRLEQLDASAAVLQSDQALPRNGEEDGDMSFLPALVAALIAVESGGDSRAVGDGGKGLGCLQIHPEVVEDVNRIYGAKFQHADAARRAAAIAICCLYLEYWGAHDGPATAEKCARIWNGGPDGHKEEATRGYWEKVRLAMAQRRGR